MASNTPNLNLLKKDPVTDGNDTFNIQTMLNDNWDKIDTAFANVPEQIKELTQAAITYKKIPSGITSINALTEIGIYFTPDLSLLTDTPINPVEGNWTDAHAIINVYNVMPPYAGASFLRTIELYVTYGTTKQYYFRRNTKISISGSNTTITHGSWERMITSAGGTISGDMVINGTTQAKGPLQAYGDGGDALSLIGKTHNYISFYPQGVNAGRQGYAGFPTSGSKEFNINATDVLRFSDKSSAITLGEITGMAYQGNVPSPFLELGYNRNDSGPSFVDFHSTPGQDHDGRILVDANKMMFLQANAISFTDQWRSYTLNGIYDDIQSVKQSGVNYKNNLVAALNANGTAASSNEDWNSLINKINTISSFKTVNVDPSGNSLSIPAGFKKEVRLTPVYGNYVCGSEWVSLQTITLRVVDSNGRDYELYSYTISNNHSAGYLISSININSSQAVVSGVQGASNKQSFTKVTNFLNGFNVSSGFRLYQNYTSGQYTGSANFYTTNAIGG